MASGDSTITVTISGTEYNLRSGGNPEYVRKLAAYVDHKIAEVQKGVGDLPANRLAILAALNIADELGRSRGVNEDDLVRIDRRIRSLIELVDKDGAHAS